MRTVQKRHGLLRIAVTEKEKDTEHTHTHGRPYVCMSSVEVVESSQVELTGILFRAFLFREDSI